MDALRTAIREKRPITVQLLNYKKDGTPFWNRLSITPVQDHSGVVTHFIGVQSDVTEEKQAKDALQNANERLEAANRAMQQDLEAAAELQQSLLPVELPKVRGMDFAFRFRPCRDVGGDSINIFSLDDRHVALYILDVSGHGVAAALLSVTLTHMLSVLPDRSFLYHAATDNPDAYSITSPAEVVSRLNRHFLPNQGVSQFFTMIYGILNTQTGEFCYTAAGHFGPIHVSRNSSPGIGETGGIPRRTPGKHDLRRAHREAFQGRSALSLYGRHHGSCERRRRGVRRRTAARETRGEPGFDSWRPSVLGDGSHRKVVRIGGCGGRCFHARN